MVEMDGMTMEAKVDALAEAEVALDLLADKHHRTRLEQGDWESQVRLLAFLFQGHWVAPEEGKDLELELLEARIMATEGMAV
jgi:hypothetical protein